MKTVTVIIPTYNRWPHVCTAIDSVLRQTHNGTRCMVVDDASSDDTVALLEEKYGTDIDIIRNPENRGQSFCRNLGATSSTSDYICFLDSDDTLDPSSVESRVSLFDELGEGVKVSFGIVRKAGRASSTLTDRKKRGDRLTLMEYLNDMGWCLNNAPLMDRQAFVSEGLYNPQLRNREDIELIIRLLCRFEFYYCGSEVGQVRDVCENRARDNFANILDPSNSFAHFIQANPAVRDSLPPQTIKRLIASEVEEQLRAFYRMERYSEYRKLFQQASEQGQVINKGKFYKRYLLSFIKGIFKADKMIREVSTDISISSQFGAVQRKHENVVFDMELNGFCQKENNLCDRLDELIEGGYCYKSDGTSTVASVNHDGHYWVIKRYNHKGLSSTIKLLARKSRAERAFCKGLVLRNIGISTPRPLLHAVRYQKGLPFSCYIINERSPGDTICNLFDSHKISADEWLGIVAKTGDILSKLHARGITHGDIKPTNILMNDGDIEIIDLDSMRMHWSRRIFDHFRHKDMNALTNRVAGYIYRE